MISGDMRCRGTARGEDREKRITEEKWKEQKKVSSRKGDESRAKRTDNKLDEV